MSALRRLAFVAGAALAPAIGEAQAGNQSPTPANTISVDGGYAFRFGAAGRNEGYYRVVFQGRPVRDQGTPFKYARALDLLAPTPDRAAGDVSAISLRYENDQASAGGGLLSTLPKSASVALRTALAIQKIRHRGWRFVQVYRVAV